jgi:hypothetical protein
LKRDPDLIRDILLKYEESDFNHFEERLATSWGILEKGTDTEQGKQNQRHAEHVRWLLDDGMLVQLTGAKTHVRMTSSACDFIENVKNEGIWAETKAAVAKEGGSVALELLKKVAMETVKAKLKKHTNIEL